MPFPVCWFSTYWLQKKKQKNKTIKLTSTISSDQIYLLFTSSPCILIHNLCQNGMLGIVLLTSTILLSFLLFGGIFIATTSTTLFQQRKWSNLNLNRKNAFRRTTILWLTPNKFAAMSNRSIVYHKRQKNYIEDGMPNELTYCDSICAIRCCRSWSNSLSAILFVPIE